MPAAHATCQPHYNCGSAMLFPHHKVSINERKRHYGEDNARDE